MGFGMTSTAPISMYGTASCCSIGIDIVAARCVEQWLKRSPSAALAVLRMSARAAWDGTCIITTGITRLDICFSLAAETRVRSNFEPYISLLSVAFNGFCCSGGGKNARSSTREFDGSGTSSDGTSMRTRIGMLSDEVWLASSWILAIHAFPVVHT